jgi:hypothetical protein
MAISKLSNTELHGLITNSLNIQDTFTIVMGFQVTNDVQDLNSNPLGEQAAISLKYQPWASMLPPKVPMLPSNQDVLSTASMSVEVTGTPLPEVMKYSGRMCRYPKTRPGSLGTRSLLWVTR